MANILKRRRRAVPPLIHAHRRTPAPIGASLNLFDPWTFPVRRLDCGVMQLLSTLTCPACQHSAVEAMPTDACQFFYDCKGCGTRLKPLAGNCCVFCSYGSVPCPPIQEYGKGACCS
jgi:hypothetical protein